MKNQEATWRFVMLGGDSERIQAYANAAAMRGYGISHFKSMHDLGYLCRLREFDAAIVQEGLQPLSGLELAEYLDKLFQSLPMVLLTEDAELFHVRHMLPASIVDCLPLRHEPIQVLERAEVAVTQRISPFLSILNPRT